MSYQLMHLQNTEAISVKTLLRCNSDNVKIVSANIFDDLRVRFRSPQNFASQKNLRNDLHLNFSSLANKEESHNARPRLPSQ
jgi:hypothetical protein